jgi:tetratricopeptide (TPR) repeat protein
MKCLSTHDIPDDERIADCTSALESGNSSSYYVNRAYDNRASAYFRKGDFDRATDDYGQMIKLYPENVHAYQGRTFAYFRRGDFGQAIADYGRAIELYPNDKYGYLRRGEAYACMDDPDHGIADFNQAIALDPEFTVAYRARGNAYMVKGDLDRAIADETRAIELDPKLKGAYFARGGAYLVEGDLDRAIADYDQIIQLDPKDARAYGMRGIAHLNSGSLPKALDDLNQSSVLNPKSASTALLLDVVVRRSNLPSHLAEAIQQFDMTKWPAPIIRLFLDALTPEEVLAAADDADPNKKKGQVCEANFYSGELALVRGTREEAVRLFRVAAADCPRIATAWSMARAELKAMNANP